MRSHPHICALGLLPQPSVGAVAPASRAGARPANPHSESLSEPGSFMGKWQRAGLSGHERSWRGPWDLPWGVQPPTQGTGHSTDPWQSLSRCPWGKAQFHSPMWQSPQLQNLPEAGRDVHPHGGPAPSLRHSSQLQTKQISGKTRPNVLSVRQALCFSRRWGGCIPSAPEATAGSGHSAGGGPWRHSHPRFS